LNWLCDISSQIAEHFLERWPTVEKLQKAKPSTIRRFFVEHNSRNPERVEKRLEEIRNAIPATHDSAVIAASSSAVAVLIQVLRQLRDGIASYDAQIEALAQAHPDFAVFDSLPGAGAALVPRLIAALGSRRDRYRTAHELQCYSGIAPVVESSGKQRWVHYRRSCPKFLRQTFHEWSLHSIGFSEWAKEYYRQQRGKGKSHHSSVRALAFKWIRILFRCWQNRTPYNEAVYVSQQSRRNEIKSSPNSAVKIEWKNRSGFNKLSSSAS
jgi:transposase